VRRSRSSCLGARRRVAALIGVSLLGLALSDGVVLASSTHSTTPVTASLSTSISTTSGTWVTLPMGHLDQPLNTFWQLLLRPEGATRWRNATNLAVATNGGIVLASPGGPTLLAGTRPSHLLRFSALASTSSAGRDWTAGPPVAALAPRTNALAEDNQGNQWALVGGQGAERVLENSVGATTWSSVTSEISLSATPSGRTCGLSDLTSLLSVGDGVVIGGTCERPGHIGLFWKDGTAWKLEGPALTGELAHGLVTVLAISARSGLIQALLAVRAADLIHFVAIRASSVTGRWRFASGPTAPSQISITSLGATEAGMFVLWSEHHHLHLCTVAGNGAWATLPSPPTGTATVAFGPGSTVEALAVSDTVLRVFALKSSDLWKKIQSMNVPVQFGSSG
jgi:hypothetical protein